MQNSLFDYIDSGANFSNDRQYRYSLWRIWDKQLPLIMFIGLNPSTANEDLDDATIKSVKRLVKNNGFGGFYMMNCWAFIATKPEDLKFNPMSNKWNDDILTYTAFRCKHIIFAWGNFKIVSETGRDKELKAMFPNAKVLGLNKNGSPKHPLYIKSNTKFIDYPSCDSGGCHD